MIFFCAKEKNIAPCDIVQNTVLDPDQWFLCIRKILCIRTDPFAQPSGQYCRSNSVVLVTTEKSKTNFLSLIFLNKANSFLNL